MALGRDLPDDLVADVLRRLPPHSLVVCRCVCKAWRDLIDDDDDLRAVLLPRSVGGIFINYCSCLDSYSTSEFFARPTTGPSISGDLELINPAGLPGDVMDHCNGLVLYIDFSNDDHERVAVANPATRQWTRLPPLPPEPEPEPDSSETGKKKSFIRRTQYLVYDPTVSPHYHVFLIHSAIDKDLCKSTLQRQGYVCSSESWRWEERCFVPESCGIVEMTTMAIDVDNHKPKVYWRGNLYLLCKKGFVLRISISTAIYTLIPSPVDRSRGSFLLGRSEKGVYCGFEHDRHGLEIFLLNESCGSGQTAVWELKHSVDLKTFALKLHAREGSSTPNGPWMLEDINYYKDPAHKRREVVEEKFEWNSDDDDNVLHIEDMVEGRYHEYTDVLGFHPYKEVVFLNAALSRAVAYHWNTSKFQDLGNIYPTDYHNIGGPAAGIETAFIYTPCWMADFPENSSEAPIEDSDSVQAAG